MTYQPTNVSARPRVLVPVEIYTPKEPPQRPGAADHLALPSLVNGKPVPHKAPVGLASEVPRFAHAVHTDSPKN